MQDNKELNELIDDVEDKKYIEFAKKAKKSLEDKIRNNPKITKSKAELDRLNSLKDAFVALQKDKKVTPEEPKEEPTDIEEPTEPKEEPTDIEEPTEPKEEPKEEPTDIEEPKEEPTDIEEPKEEPTDIEEPKEEPTEPTKDEDK